ncbi:substrate-binding periplasmic protein [Colwelliaceae bacterium 6441]
MNIQLSVVLITLLVFAPLSKGKQQQLTSAESTVITIQVGAGVRPPFLIDNNKHQYQGAGPEILQALNQIQQQFYFVMNEIPSKRKTAAVSDGRLDIIMWDNVNWGWRDESFVQSSELVRSKDIYFTFNDNNKSQDYFDNFNNKKLAMVIGYHYKVANFIVDIQTLKKNFNVTMVRNEEASIRMAIAGRVDIAIVSETALNWYLLRFPQYTSKILIADKYDTQYSRHFVLPEDAAIKPFEINNLLMLADKKGLLAPIYRKYGLVKPVTFIKH